MLEFTKGVEAFSPRVCVVDNQLCFIQSHVAGARGFNVHVANYWPQWGVNLMEAYRQISDVLLPYYALAGEIASHTGGEGMADKLALETIGFASSPTRPPTRDVRDQFRDKTRQMLEKAGVPAVQ